VNILLLINETQLNKVKAATHKRIQR